MFTGDKEADCVIVRSFIECMDNTKVERAVDRTVIQAIIVQCEHLLSVWRQILQRIIKRLRFPYRPTPPSPAISETINGNNPWSPCVSVVKF